jgi:hypothetical protein
MIVFQSHRLIMPSYLDLLMMHPEIVMMHSASRTDCLEAILVPLIMGSVAKPVAARLPGRNARQRPELRISKRGLSESPEAQIL